METMWIVAKNTAGFEVVNEMSEPISITIGNEGPYRVLEIDHENSQFLVEIPESKAGKPLAK